MANVIIIKWGILPTYLLYSTTFLPTYLPTYQPTYLPTTTYSPTHPLAHLLPYLLIYLSATHLLAYPPTHDTY